MPIGLPDDITLEQVGGPLSNYEDEVADPTTDQDEELMNVVKAAVTGMSRTAMRAWYAFIGKASNPVQEPASAVHGNNWNNDPSYKPAYNRTGTGVVRLTYGATVIDELTVEHTINIRHAWGFSKGPTLYHVRCDVVAANIIDVYIFNAAGAATDAVGVPIVIAWW